MLQYDVGAPFERSPSKLQDPSQRARGEINHRLIAMDYLTKRPQLYSIPNQETSVVADILVTNCTVI
jgi:hypothetical protein